MKTTNFAKEKLIAKTNFLTKEEWEEIEIKVSDFENKVGLCMLKLGNPTKYENFKTNSRIEILGEEIYLKYFHEEISKKFFKNKKKKSQKKTKEIEKNDSKKKHKGGQKKGKNDKYEQYMNSKKNENLTNMCKNLLNLSEENLSNLFTIKNFGFLSNVLEEKLIAFLVLYSKTKKSDRTKKFIYEFLLGLQKVLDNYSNFEGTEYMHAEQTCEVSETLFEMVSGFCSKKKKKYEFSINDLFCNYPELIYVTKYDGFFEKIDIRPFPSQENLIDLIKENIESNNNLLLFYKTVVGSGKTSAALALLSLIKEYNEKNKTKKPISLLFCCGLTQVRVQVGQLVYNALNYDKDLSFAIASTYPYVDPITNQQIKRVRIANHFSCENEENPLLIISDMKTSCKLLKMQKKRFFLFIDDPVIDADQENSPITDMFVKLMSVAPNFTVISSATLPSVDSVPLLVKSYKINHPKTVIEEISSETTSIGMQIFVDFQYYFFPHTNCKDASQLQNVIDSVKENPFLARMYPASSLHLLRDKLVSLNPETEKEDLESYFSSTRKLNQKEFQNYAVDILEELLELDNEKIKEFCKLESFPQKSLSSLSYKTLFTHGAHKLTGGCLIATKNPLKFSIEIFMDHLKKYSISNIKKDYETQKLILQEKKKALENIKNEIERLKSEQRIEKEFNPIINFPLHLKINTKHHFEYYGLPKNSENPHTIEFRKDYTLADLFFNIDDEILLMLFAGIGIFNEKIIQCKEYNKEIRRKAKNMFLAYLISHQDILYGANLPVHNVIIDDSIVNNFSISSIFQIMGRAGRIGKSWISNCYLSTNLAQKIESYVQCSGEEKAINQIEAINIEKKIQSLYGIKNSKNEANIEQITIFYHNFCIDGYFAMISAFMYYSYYIYEKYNDQCPVSEFDFLQYIHLYPSPQDDETLFESFDWSNLKTVLFLDFVPFNFKKILEKMEHIENIVIIDHHISNYRKLQELIRPENIDLKVKITIKCEMECAASILSYEFFTKLMKKDFDVDCLKAIFLDDPNRFDLNNYKNILKHVNDHDMSHGANFDDTEAISTILYEMLKDDELARNNLNCISKMMTLPISQENINEGKRLIQLRTKEMEDIILRKIVIIHLVVDPENNQSTKKVLGLDMIPISMMKYRSFLAEILMNKYAAKYNLSRIAVITWKGWKNFKAKKFMVHFSMRSKEESFDCAKFCEKFGGGGHPFAAGCSVSKGFYESLKMEKIGTGFKKYRYTHKK